MRTPDRPITAKSRKVTAKNRVTPQTSHTRFTREANTLYAGTNTSISSAWPAEA